MSSSTIFKDIHSFRLGGQETSGRTNLKIMLKILAKSSNFLKVNFQHNTVSITDMYQPISKPLIFDKVFNEYSEPVKVEHMLEHFQRWENILIFSFSNNTQQMNFFQKEINMIKNILATVPVELQKMQQQKNIQDLPRNTLAVIKSPSRLSAKFSNPNLSVRDGEKSIKISVSFYAYGSEGALDFGKLALDKIKMKKEINELESNCLRQSLEVPLLPQIVEDAKTGELQVKGLTKFESIDPEQLVNFFQNAVLSPIKPLQSSYCQEYLIKKFPENDEKFYHQVFHMTIQSLQEPKHRSQFYIVDFAAPIQSALIEQQYPQLNPFLQSTLLTFANFMKEYHKDKYGLINNLNVKAIQHINLDSNPISRLLKRLMLSKESILFPLFVINSKEEFKEESKQILTLTQQVQGIFQTLNLVEEMQQVGGSKFMTPMIGNQGFLKPEEVASAIQMEKLGKENQELRRQVEHLKKLQKNKLDEFKVLMGLDCDLEALLKAKPNSKEHNIIKFYKEARERAETLGRINKDLDKKCNTLSEEVEKISKEKDFTEKKYRKLQHQLDRKIQAFQEDMQAEDRNYELEFQEDMKMAKDKLEEHKQQNYDKVKEKANLLFTLSRNTEENTNTLSLAYDYKDRGDKFAEHEYKSQLLEKTREHKENIHNMKSTQSQQIKELDKYLTKIAPECKEKKDDIQNKISLAKEEMIKLYELTRKQQDLISKVEQGNYNMGKHSHYVPLSHKPTPPSQENFSELFTSLNKKKVKETLSNLYEKPNKNKQDKEKFMETFMMKTQQITLQNNQQLLESQKRYKLAEEKGLLKKISQPNLPPPDSARYSNRRHLGTKKRSSGRNSKQNSRATLYPQGPPSARSVSPGRISKPDYEKLRVLHNIMDIQVDQIENEKDLYAFAKDLQMEYWREIESEENPKELQGEHLSKVMGDLEKFKQLYEQELKMSNERMYQEGVNNRMSAIQMATMGGDILNYMNQTQFGSSFKPGTRQQMSSQKSQRLFNGSKESAQKPYLLGNQKLEFQLGANRAMSRGNFQYNSQQNLLGHPFGKEMEVIGENQGDYRLKTAKQKVRWY